MNTSRIENITNKMFGGWKYITHLEQHLNGSIWITWRQDYYQVVAISKITQVVTCKIIYLPKQSSFYVTFVYAYNHRCKRRGLWEYLESQMVVCKSPWMVIGDFNLVLHIEDRIGEIQSQCLR